MKSKEIFRLLVNPFTRIAGWQALGIGLFVLFLTSYIGYKSNVVFDSVLGVHITPVSLPQAIVIHLVSWLCLVLVMWIAGKIFSKSDIRLVDIAGTMAVARIPYLFVALAGFLPSIPTALNELNAMMMNMSFSVSKLSGLFLFLIIVFLVSAWFIILSYNAFSISCNIKGSRGAIVFSGGIIISLLLSTIINFILMKKFFAIAAFAGLSLTSPAATPADYKEINEIAVQTAESLQKGAYDQVTASFDSTMLNVFPKEKMAEFMSQMKMQYGNFQEVKTKEISNADSGGYRGVFIPCIFEKGKFTLQIFFSANNQISGLFIRPAL